MKTLHELSHIAWNTGTPFMVQEAVKFMERVVHGNIFEWGSGGSTIWFARRADHVISIEHDPRWFERVGQRLVKERVLNVDLRLVPQRPPEKYAEEICGFKDDSFDLVSVDGRNRVLCIYNALNKVAHGGFLVLDNSERTKYREGIELLNSWERTDFVTTWTTTVFRKP